MASSTRTFRIHLPMATGIGARGSIFGRPSSMYVLVKVDGSKCGQSKAAYPSDSGQVMWDLHTEIHCSRGAAQLQFEVRRIGFFNRHVTLGGCSLALDSLVDIDNKSLPLWETSGTVIGYLQVSVQRVDQDDAQPLGGALMSHTAEVSGGSTGMPLHNTSGTTWPNQGSTAVGLRNCATGGLTNLAVQHGSAGMEEPGPGGQGLLLHQGTRGLTNISGQEEPGSSVGQGFQQQGTRGLTNIAGGSDAPIVSLHTQSNLDRSGTQGLTNWCHTSPDSQGAPGLANRSQTGLGRQGTQGLTNRAAVDEDGTRLNALPRARELLAELPTVGVEGAEDFQKLAQVVDHLRHAPATDLQSRSGEHALSSCRKLIEAFFKSALTKADDKGMGAALSLAGRLPSPDDDGDAHRATLQDVLRREWNAWKMAEALRSAQSRVDAAARGGEALEVLMDQLDLAEFHARLADKDLHEPVEALLAKLQPKLERHLQGLVKAGQWDEVESALGIIGAARLYTLNLHSIRQNLQCLKGLSLLRNALLPIQGQIGFPELKRRQLRHAQMTARTALQEDPSGQSANALRHALLQELIPACMAHSPESAEWALRTAFELRIGGSELWDATEEAFRRVPSSHKAELVRMLQRLCGELGKSLPNWLLSPQQMECKEALRGALSRNDCGQIRAACQRILETKDSKDLFHEEVRLAVNRLRQEYQLPASWDVEAMIGTAHQNLLAKNEITDRALLSLFDELLKTTAQPAIRTRDRRGGVPQSFIAMRAVQVMNGQTWRSYIDRRNQIVLQCRKAKARHDLRHWQEQLNGPVASMDVVKKRLADINDMPALEPEANEVWLLHGTSHAAAEGITSLDFDMTRASPTGLFGAGVYFAESSSKADEYVEGRGSPELFPVLLCRVCLGHIWYCDERRPDRRELERKCLKDDWHSVIGDRKKTSGTFREFVIYDNLQAFPAYIIYYARHW